MDAEIDRIWPLRIALKIDVNTLRGTLIGVPRLVELLRRYNAGATFLFTLGRDQTGRAARNLLRTGFAGKLRRMSVFEHYGARTLLYGTMLPAPDIAKRGADVMKGVRDAGFETGVQSLNRYQWRQHILTADEAWTREQMTEAIDRYTSILGSPPRVHGAAGWQMNKYAYRLTQRLGYDYCSDTRGTHPFLPVQNAELIACPQLPTTLPTIDELIGLNAVTQSNVVDRLLDLSGAIQAPHGHIFTLHAELEGIKLSSQFEALLTGWQRRDIALVSLGDYLNTASTARIPHHVVTQGTVDGRIGAVAMQGGEFLA